MAQASSRREDARSLPPPKKRLAPFQFGTPLQKVPCTFTPDCGSVPAFLVEAAEVIRDNVTCEGLFRKSGDLRRQTTLRKLVECGETLAGLDVHDVTSLVKTFFRMLPVPLVPRLFHDPLLHSLQLPEDKRAEAVQGLCFSLPAPHLSCLRFFMLLLVHISDHVDTNRMSPRNLAVVLTPSLIRLKTRSKLMNQEELRALPQQTALVEYLICHADSIGVMTQEMHQQSLRLTETTLRKKAGKSSAKKVADKGGRSTDERVQLAHAVLGLVADLHYRPNSCSSVSDSNIVDTPCLHQERMASTLKKRKHKHRHKRRKEGEGADLRRQDYEHNDNTSACSPKPKATRHVRSRPGGDRNKPTRTRDRLPGGGKNPQDFQQPIMGAQMSLMLNRWKPQQNNPFCPPPSSKLLESWSRAIPLIQPKDTLKPAFSDTSRETFTDLSSHETLSAPSDETVVSKSSGTTQSLAKSCSVDDHTATMIDFSAVSTLKSHCSSESNPFLPPETAEADWTPVKGTTGETDLTPSTQLTPPAEAVSGAGKTPIEDLKDEGMKITFPTCPPVILQSSSSTELKTSLPGIRPTSSPAVLQPSPCVVFPPSPPMVLPTCQPAVLVSPPVALQTSQPIVLPSSAPAVLPSENPLVHAATGSENSIGGCMHKEVEVSPTSSFVQLLSSQAAVPPTSPPTPMESQPVEWSDVHLPATTPQYCKTNICPLTPPASHRKDESLVTHYNTATPMSHTRPKDGDVQKTDQAAHIPAVIVSSQSSQKTGDQSQDRLRALWVAEERPLYSRNGSGVSMNSEKPFGHLQQGSLHHSVGSEDIFLGHGQHLYQDAIEHQRGVSVAACGDDANMTQLHPVAKDDECVGARYDTPASHTFSRASSGLMSPRRLVQERMTTRMREAQLSGEPHTHGGRSIRSMRQLDRRNTITGLHFNLRGPPGFSEGSLSHCSCPDCTFLAGPILGASHDAFVSRIESVSPRMNSCQHDDYYSMRRVYEHPGATPHQYQEYYYDTGHHNQHKRSNLVLNRRKRITHSADSCYPHHSERYQQYGDTFVPDFDSDPYRMGGTWHEQHMGQFGHSGPSYYDPPVCHKSSFDVFYDECDEPCVQEGYYNEEGFYERTSLQDAFRHQMPPAQAQNEQRDLTATQKFKPHRHYYVDTHGPHKAWTPHKASIQTFTPYRGSPQHPRNEDFNYARDPRSRHRRLTKQQECGMHCLSDAYGGLAEHHEALPGCTHRDQWPYSQCVGDGLLNDCKKTEELGDGQGMGPGEAEGDGEANVHAGTGTFNNTSGSMHNEVKTEATRSADTDLGTCQNEEFYSQRVLEKEVMNFQQPHDPRRGTDLGSRGQEGDAGDDGPNISRAVDDMDDLASLRQRLEMMHIGVSSPSGHLADEQDQCVQQDVSGDVSSNARQQEKQGMWRNFPPNYFSRHTQDEGVSDFNSLQRGPTPGVPQHGTLKVVQGTYKPEMGESSGSLSTCSRNSLFDKYSPSQKHSSDSASSGRTKGSKKTRSPEKTGKGHYTPNRNSSSESASSTQPGASRSSSRTTTLSTVLSRTASTESSSICMQHLAQEYYGSIRNTGRESHFLCTRHRKQLMSMQDEYTTHHDDSPPNCPSEESVLPHRDTDTEEFTNNALASDSTSNLDVHSLSAQSHENILSKSRSHISSISRLDVQRESQSETTEGKTDLDRLSEVEDVFCIEENDTEDVFCTEQKEDKKNASSSISFYFTSNLKLGVEENKAEPEFGTEDRATTEHGSKDARGCQQEVSEESEREDHEAACISNVLLHENDKIIDTYNLVPVKAFFQPDGDITFN